MVTDPVRVTPGDYRFRFLLGHAHHLNGDSLPEIRSRDEPRMERILAPRQDGGRGPAHEHAASLGRDLTDDAAGDADEVPLADRLSDRRRRQEQIR
ncbi:MAG: hypothetical protein J4F98_13165 [Acidobacteria bacterium]|nr:hypothetical protein [Acidobacteriota bacterium]